MRRLITYPTPFIFIISAWLLGSCANIVAPSGGPKDVIAPKITHEAPENFSKNFKGNTIVIEFDEYVRLNNPAQEIVISPAIDPEPEYSVKGKKLTVKWKGTLDSATTYTIAFGEAIKDANESNSMSGFKYVFSTGTELDSLSLTGKVISAKDNKPAGKVLVMLYKDFADSAVITKKPYYFTRTTDSGNFSLENIRAGEYKIYSLKDENYNYLFDLPNEEIAFLDSTVKIDSTKKLDIILPLFKEHRNQKLSLATKDDSKTEYLKFTLTKKAENVELVALSDTTSIGIPEYNSTRDSITLWYTRSWKGDSLILRLNGADTDSFTVRYKPSDTDVYKEKLGKPKLPTKPRTPITYAPAGSLFVALNRPVKSASFENAVLTQDSPKVKLDLKFIRFADSTQRKIEVDFTRKPGIAYTITFPDSIFIDYYGIYNDSLEWNILTKTPEDYGSLKLTVTGEENTAYILQLLDKNEASVIERAFTGSETLFFADMLPDTYQPLIIYDANKNRKWDTGNYLQHLQPERTYRHTEPIVLRANWEMEVELKIK